MLSREDNEILCRVGPGTPMGAVMREYWIPAGLSSELPQPVQKRAVASFCLAHEAHVRQRLAPQPPQNRSSGPAGRKQFEHVGWMGSSSREWARTLNTS